MAIVWETYDTWDGICLDTVIVEDRLELQPGKETGTYTSQSLDISTIRQAESISMYWDQILNGTVEAAIIISTDGGITWSDIEYQNMDKEGRNTLVSTVSSGKNLSNGRMKFIFRLTSLSSIDFNSISTGVSELEKVSKLYGQFLMKALNKEVALGNGATGLKAMLCTSAYNPTYWSNQYKSNVTNEITGEGYTPGGKAITSVTVDYDAASNTIKINSDPITWVNASITARIIVVYDSTPSTDETRPLIGYVDFGQDLISANGEFTIGWNENGMFTLTTV